MQWKHRRLGGKVGDHLDSNHLFSLFCYLCPNKNIILIKKYSFRRGKKETGREIENSTGYWSFTIIPRIVNMRENVLLAPTFHSMKVFQLEERETFRDYASSVLRHFVLFHFPGNGLKLAISLPSYIIHTQMLSSSIE